MDIGVLSVVRADESLADALPSFDNLGVDAVKHGCGGFVGDDHLPRRTHLDDEAKQAELLELIDEYNLRIGALSIEHEDSLTSGQERFTKAVDVLDRAVFETQLGEGYWG